MWSRQWHIESLSAVRLQTGGELQRNMYNSICAEIGANPASGITKPLLLLMYTPGDEGGAGFGDAFRDFNMIFGAT